MTNFTAARYYSLLALLFASSATNAAESGNGHRWSVAGAGEYTSDSDTIISTRELVQATHDASGGLSFNAQLETIRMEADRPSGLITVKGNESVVVNSVMLGVKQQYDPQLGLELATGFEQSTADTNTLPFLLRADWQPVEPLRAIFTVSREMYALSPKAISLDVSKTGGNLQLIWQATPRITVDSKAAYDDFSDDNVRRSFITTPSYRIIKDTNYSFDAGVRFYWYGFNDRHFNGYYSPESYHSYTIPLTYYRQFGEHNFLVSLAPGVFRDQNNKGYQFAGDMVAETNFKVTEAWDFNAHVAFIRSGGITSSDYEQGLMGLELKYHF